MEPYYFWIILFGFFAYFIVTDENVARVFLLAINLIKFEYEKQKWWILHNPRNPIVKYLMWRKYVKLAEELQKELNKNKN
jgi:hypothetical protein